jgi:hypothetical protein
VQRVNGFTELLEKNVFFIRRYWREALEWFCDGERVEHNGNGVRKVHARRFFSRGNSYDEISFVEFFVFEATAFAPEKQRCSFV